MARLFYTVDDLVASVRSLLDEENQLTIDDAEDILPSLNRAQDFAANILARHYKDPFLKVTPQLDLVGGKQEYTIPEDALEDRLEKVDIKVGSDTYEVKRVNFRELSNLESNLRVQLPTHYAIRGRKIRFAPAPTGSFKYEAWYLKAPDKLVKAYGRIVRVDADNMTVDLNSISSDLAIDLDSLGAYVNIIDGQTGIVKGTYEMSDISTSNNRITLKSTGLTRTTVLNRTLATTLADLQDPDSNEVLNTVDVSPDDYLCPIMGTCIPFFGRPLNNYIVRAAVAELGGIKLDENSLAVEQQLLDAFEKQVERSWVNRERQIRIKKRSKNWERSRRRWPRSQS